MSSCGSEPEADQDGDVPIDFGGVSKRFLRVILAARSLTDVGQSVSLARVNPGTLMTLPGEANRARSRLNTNASAQSRNNAKVVSVFEPSAEIEE
jgi:hypothetical protein